MARIVPSMPPDHKTKCRLGEMSQFRHNPVIVTKGGRLCGVR